MTILRSRLMRRATMVLTLAAASGATYVAFASHQFSDVPPTAIFHDAVEWMVNRGVTSGCEVGLYCPDANVTRAQMALFMNRLGVALTPSVITANGAPGAFDLDATNTHCVTSSYTPAFPQRAILYAKSGLESAADFSYWIFGVVSTDGGATFSNVNGFSNGPESSAPVAGHQAPAFTVVYHTLTPGTAYRFAVRFQRASGSPGTGDPTNGWCGLHVEIVNRNGATSPFAPQEAPEAGQSQIELQ